MRLLISLCFITATALAAPKLGEKAPDFTLTDTNGKPHQLSKLTGKTVVLEWLNHECPFVKKHYDSNNMQKLQKEYTGKGVVWFSVNSGAAGKQGAFTPEKSNQVTKEKNASPTAVLLDGDGKVGKAYGAKTTPHMYIVDPKGLLVYAGGIDDKPTTEVSDVPAAKNFVAQALNEVLAGKPVSQAATTPYGCSVKY